MPRRKRPARPRPPRRPRPPLPAGWLTAHEVANRYHVTHQNICHHLRRGSLPGVKWMGVWMVKADELPGELPPTGRPPKQ
jgi:hypothetical protein